MKATYHITRIDGSKFQFDIPVESRKAARQVINDTIQSWATEGWFAKQDGEFDIWMVRGTDDPTYHIVIE